MPSETVSRITTIYSHPISLMGDFIFLIMHGRLPMESFLLSTASIMGLSYKSCAIHKSAQGQIQTRKHYAMHRTVKLDDLYAIIKYKKMNNPTNKHATSGFFLEMHIPHMNNLGVEDIQDFVSFSGHCWLNCQLSDGRCSKPPRNCLEKVICQSPPTEQVGDL